MISAAGSRLTRARAVSLYLHPMIAVVVPFLFLSLVFEIVVTKLITVALLVVAVLPLLLLVVGAVEYLVGWWLGARRENGVAPLLRELLVILIIGALAILALMGAILSPLSGLTRPDFWVATIALFLQWLLTQSFRRRMRDHTLFIALFERREKAETPEVYREYGEEAADTLAALSWVRKRILFLLVVVLAALSVVMWGFGFVLSAAEVIATVAYVVVSLLAVRSLRTLAFEQLAFAEGAAWSPRQLTVAAAQAAFLLVVVCLAAIPIATSHALLSAALLGRFLRWLASLLASLAPHGAPLPPLPPFQPPAAPTPMEEALRSLPAASPPAWTALLRAILQALGWGVLGAGALALLAFLLRPLLRLRWAAGGARRPAARAVRYLVELAQGFAARLRLLFAGGALRGKGFLHRHRVDGRGGAPESGARDPRGAEGGKEELRARLPLALFLRAFRRLVRWGDRIGVRFSPAYAPREYAGLLGKRVPEAEPVLAEIAAIFEEGLYSGRSLSDERLAAYFRAIGRVARMRSEKQ